MQLSVRPSKLKGVLAVPGSKSHTIRGLVLAALATGSSRLIRPLYSEDTEACIHGLTALGADIQSDSKTGSDIQVTGFGGKPKPRLRDINLANSGTSTRLLTAVAALADSPICLDGDASLRTRPMASLLCALQNLGAKADAEGDEGHLPITIQGPLKGGEATVAGITSQFLSALLLVAPLLPEATRIQVLNLHERPYVEMTLAWLKHLNIQYTRMEGDVFEIPGRQQYNAFTHRIPADFSTACFPLVAAAVCESLIILEGLDFSDAQGDKAIFEFLQEMGLSVTHQENQVHLRRKPLQGGTFDLNACPDALPVMAVAGCFASGKTVLTNVAQARIKECDRIQAMTAELGKMGAQIEELPDGMVIHQSSLQGTQVQGHNDHRIVMALTLAGLAASGETGVDTAEAVAVTYPEFVSHFQQLGAQIRLIQDA